MHKLKSIGILFFCCATIFLFTDSIRISRKHLKDIAWYLDQKADSASFFSADTLRFFTPYPMWKIVVGNLGDTLENYPYINFGYFQKDEFAMNLNKKDSFAKRSDWVLSKKQLEGKFIIDRKSKTIKFDFYTFDENKSTDNIDDWIKGPSKTYKVIEFTRSKLVLVRI